MTPSLARPRATGTGAPPRALLLCERLAQSTPVVVSDPPLRPPSPPDPGAGRPPVPAAADRAERDAELAACLAEAAAGSATAFERFYDASYGHARALARRMLRGLQRETDRESDCEDLLADAYFEAWRGLARFDPARGSAVTWLLQIVRSRALDLLRRRAAQATERLGDEPAREPASDEDPAAQLWQLQAGSRLHAALAQLSATERWVLGLAYFRDLSQTEIAAATGLPLGTVKSHAARAQARLRAALTGSESPAR